MNDMQQHCQAKLEQERANIIEYLQQPATAEDIHYFDPDEQQVAWQMRVKLCDIEHALQRLADNRFGTCQACHQPIDADRLLVLPFAELCISCQRRQEQRENGQHRQSQFSNAHL